MSTLTCPNCQRENAYFDIIDENGAHYTCPDCDYEWTDTSVTIDAEDEEKDEIEMDNKLDNKVSEFTLRNVFSLSIRYFEMSKIFAQDDDCRPEFECRIGDVLQETNDFHKLESVVAPKNMSQEEINKSIESEICFYLDHQDELPAFATAEDWAEFINAPVGYMEKLFTDDKQRDIIHLLPRPYEDAFINLFKNKVDDFMLQVRKNNKGSHYNDKVTKDDVVDILRAAFTGDLRELYEFSDPTLIHEIKKYFETEIKTMSKYRNDIASKGSFDDLLIKAKKENLNKIDTIVLILDHYFKEVLI